MKHSQTGLSLIELMIAITLGLVLLTGVMQVFMSSKTIYSSQQALSRVQETGRLALDFISRDIRMAGYVGCGSRSTELKKHNKFNVASNAFLYDYGTAITGYTSATMPSVPGMPTPVADTDSQIIVTRNGVGEGVKVSQLTDASQIVFTVPNTQIEADVCEDGSDRIGGLCKSDSAIIADCTKVTIFKISDISAPVAGGSNSTVTLSHTDSTWTSLEQYEPGSEVMPVVTTAYLVAQSQASGIAGIRSLYQYSNGNSLELLEGVEKLSILYGVDTSIPKDFTPNGYVATDAVTDWSQVVSVRISVVVASTEDNVLEKPQAYKLGETTITPTDKRLRQVFSTTIGIRSRAE